MISNNIPKNCNIYNKSINNEKNESSLDENNHALLKDLKNEIDKLEKEKLNLKTFIAELKEKVIDFNIANNPDNIKRLEEERDKTKKCASDSLLLCSKMAEELIILRDKLDKYNHDTNK